MSLRLQRALRAVWRLFFYDPEGGSALPSAALRLRAPRFRFGSLARRPDWVAVALTVTMVNKHAPADSLPADYTRYSWLFGQSLHSLDESFTSSAMCMCRRSIPARPRIRVTSGEQKPCREGPLLMLWTAQPPGT